MGSMQGLGSIEHHLIEVKILSSSVHLYASIGYDLSFRHSEVHHESRQPKRWVPMRRGLLQDDRHRFKGLWGVLLSL